MRVLHKRLPKELSKTLLRDSMNQSLLFSFFERDLYPIEPRVYQIIELLSHGPHRLVAANQNF